jgi:hypothetical protein
MLNNNLLALVITFVVALIWLRLNDFLAHRGLVESHLSRKLIHIGTGPIFVLCWLLFNENPINRFLAALITYFHAPIFLDSWGDKMASVKRCQEVVIDARFCEVRCIMALFLFY